MRRCQMCKGAGTGCALCKQTGIMPTTADLKYGGPFVVASKEEQDELAWKLQVQRYREPAPQIRTYSHREC